MLQLESLLANQSLLAQYNLQSTIRSDYSLGSSMQKRVGSMKVTPKQYELIKDLADEYATRAYEEGKSGYEIDCRTPSLPLQESALATTEARNKLLDAIRQMGVTPCEQILKFEAPKADK